ncbi:MAG: hypothetical protein ACI87E_000180 [Mariniblastus sp.]|jgi:hypothetical protein
MRRFENELVSVLTAQELCRLQRLILPLTMSPDSHRQSSYSFAIHSPLMQSIRA